ncbi:MAG: EF-hand domain-containing protein [Hyphomicrobiales bacterium]|nr:EF-hand domain-containing protein [Hyphomicrobiales bacterium]
MIRKSVLFVAGAAIVASSAMVLAQSAGQPPANLQPPPAVLQGPPMPMTGMQGMRPMRHGPAGHGVMRFDANRDGSVSFEEFAAGRQNRFDMFDADKDGIVTTAEIDAVLMKRLVRQRERMLKMRDFDGDGSISKQEFEFGLQQKFTRLDRNGDGKLEPVSYGNRGHHRGHYWRGHHNRGGWYGPRS